MARTPGKITFEQLRPVGRELLGAHVLNGTSVALGMLFAAGVVYWWLGEAAALSASVGAIVALLADTPAPRRGKLVHLVAGPLLGIPLFLAVQLLRGHPLELGLLLIPGTFVAFLSTAWGRRGLPVAAAIMLAMLLAMAPQPAADVSEALLRTGWCALGALSYVLWGTAANSLLNRRYRAQILADLLFRVGSLLRVHAARLQPGARSVGELLRRQAALADQLQAARDLILERPLGARRQQLAGMLIVVLQMRDHLIASELELDQMGVGHAITLRRLSEILLLLAKDVERLADDLLLGRTSALAPSHAAALEQLREQARSDARGNPDQTDAAALVRSLSTRIGDQDAAVQELAALARGEQQPDLSAVRGGWQLFVSPAYWSLQPLMRLWHWREPALRHALRASLAIGAGYAIAIHLPWGSRDYWVLITIVVVLRGNLAQTLERRDQRIIGTMIGSLIAAALLAFQTPAAVLLLVVIVSQGVAHAFAVRRYVVTAVAGSIFGLVLADLLYAGGNPAFALLERIGDTLLGAALAWLFSYVLPSWQRDQIGKLVRRTCRALARHAKHSLALASVAEVTGQPELAWRLARREAYDALSALVQATSNALAEPRSVRPPLEQLEQLQARGYQLLGQLSAIQSLLLLRRDRINLAAANQMLTSAVAEIQESLDLGHEPASDPGIAAQLEWADSTLQAVPEQLPDPLLQDSTPWLLRRLQLATTLAAGLGRTAIRTLQALKAAPPGAPEPGPD